MKIGIDISQSVYEGTGVGRFVNGLIRTVLEEDSKNEWVFFFSSLRQRVNPQLKKRILGSRHRLLEYRLPPTALSFLWNRVHRLKIEKLTGKMDWFITSDWTEGPSLMKKATVIHDLVYLRYPHTVHKVIRRTQTERMKWVKKESAVIFTDSIATRNDIVDLLGIEKKRICVNYPGVEIDKPLPREADTVLQKYGLKRPFILSVGKIEPRKNIKRLINAFGLLGDNTLDLVVVGHQGWDSETSKKRSETENVKFLNYVSDRELACLYASCLFFVYPSLYEGFGYPVAEAMRMGAAVATSNVSSMKEIGEGAALLFDPEDTGSIAKAMKELSADMDLRLKLKKQGIMKSRQFDWKRYYDAMMDVFAGN